MKIEKITDKVEKLEIKGQGCMNDCESHMWSGNTSFSQGCVYVTGEPTSNGSTWW